MATAIYLNRKLNETNINIGDVQKVVVEEIKDYIEVGTCCRTITVFTDDGIYSIHLEGAEKCLALKDPEPDEVRLT
jgi:hypothetical protein